MRSRCARGSNGAHRPPQQARWRRPSPPPPAPNAPKAFTRRAPHAPLAPSVLPRPSRPERSHLVGVPPHPYAPLLLPTAPPRRVRASSPPPTALPLRAGVQKDAGESDGRDRRPFQLRQRSGGGWGGGGIHTPLLVVCPGCRPIQTIAPLLRHARHCVHCLVAPDLLHPDAHHGHGPTRYSRDDTLHASCDHNSLVARHVACVMRPQLVTRDGRMAPCELVRSLVFFPRSRSTL